MLSLYMKYRNLKDRLMNMDNEEGQGLVEYVLIIVLIALVVITFFNPITDALIAAFARIGAAIDGTT